MKENEENEVGVRKSEWVGGWWMGEPGGKSEKTWMKWTKQQRLRKRKSTNVKLWNKQRIRAKQSKHMQDINITLR